MPDPYKYQYQYKKDGGGLLDYTSGRQSQKKAVKDVYGQIGGYDIGKEYDELATHSIYTYGAGRPSVNWRIDPKDDPTKPSLNKLKYTKEQYNAMMKGLQDTEKETKAIVTRAFNKEEVASRLEDAKTSQYFRGPDEKDKIYSGLYDAGTTYTLGEADEDMGIAAQWGWDAEASKAVYIKNLQEILDNPDPVSASYWASKKEYRHPYADMSRQLVEANKPLRSNYIEAIEAQLAGEKGKVDEIVRQNAERIAKREEAYAKLFNVNINKRYL